MENRITAEEAQKRSDIKHNDRLKVTYRLIDIACEAGLFSIYVPAKDWPDEAIGSVRRRLEDDGYEVEWDEQDMTLDVHW